MSLLNIEKLNLSFDLSAGVRQVLCDVSLSLDKGKMLAIVGESGCGKTLTAMSIINLLPKNAKIDSGKIFFNGEDLTIMSDKQMQHIRGKKIALIPQDPMTSLNPLYTIENQIVELIKIHNPQEKIFKKIALNALKEVNIPNAEERLKAYPHELSGGMKQRIIIAMALACNADLIIADEPTTALDVTVQAQIMDLLNNIKTKKQTSIILITHDLGLVSENADDVAVMYAGRIVEYTSKEELFKNPKHPYTKALFSSLPNMGYEKLTPIKGQPPTINENIKGCPFNPRCNNVFDCCLNKNPELSKNGETFVACWLFN